MPKVPLGELKPGATGRVASLGGEPAIRRRLREMGVIVGREITVVRLAPLGDPIDVKIMGYDLSLRRAEAAHVVVEVED